MENQFNNLNRDVYDLEIKPDKDKKMKKIATLSTLLLILIVFFGIFIYFSNDEQNTEEFEDATTEDNKTISRCNLINDNEMKQSCYIELAILTKDLSVCSLMDEFYRIISNCEESARQGKFIKGEVYTKLSTARDEANNGRAKNRLSRMTVESDIYLENNLNSFLGFCGSEPALRLLNDASEATGFQYYCNDAATYWVAEVGLRLGEGYFCVDFTGARRTYPESRGELITSCECDPGQECDGVSGI